MTTTATLSQDILDALKLNNLLLLQQQSSQLLEGTGLDQKELRIERMKQEFERRAMLPEDSRPPWVSQDEAAWLLGIEITPSDRQRRKIRWLHQNGELIITNGGSNSLYFLRKEVMELNQRIINEEIIVPTKF
ncbi:MAG: hypothetical protein ACRBG0_13665 [Lewinella sp.]|uniref:hypothetical protein n=1 Tax=Lewinella sp. TaxID=2004506 RepID=UPI003D6A20DE